MENKANTKPWEIIHISEKPPNSPTQPTVEVVASEIEPKFANTLIRRLNQIFPLENLRHVKRIRKKCLEGGKIQLSVILCLAFETNEQLSGFAKDLQELIDSYQLSPFLAKVCKYAASSKEEWEEQCKLWPTSYHPPTFNIDGITGFDDEDSRSICRYMKMVIDLAKSGDDSVVNAAVIVDPSARQIIAHGCDQICSWKASHTTISLGNNNLEHLTVSLEQPTASSSHPNSNGAGTHTTAIQFDKIDTPCNLSIDVACLNPWLWSKCQLKSESSWFWHPLRHAAIVAIESSADRDRRLYPDSECIKMPFGPEAAQPCSDSPAKRQKTSFGNIENDKEYNGLGGNSHSLSRKPYLCTGYDIFLVWEPCIMCAMALVHQRIRRIFYAFPNPSCGALGSVHILQGERSLNHHYAVFRVFAPEEVLGTCVINDSKVDAEQCYHQHVLAILDKLQSEMILEEQKNEPSSLQSLTLLRDATSQRAETSNGSDKEIHDNREEGFFIAKVVHPFDAEAEGELSLSVGDYIVVRQVAPTGWSEGEFKGKAGWFPSAYVEKQEKAPVGKMLEESSTS